MPRDSRVYVKASPDEQQVFRAVAEHLGLGDMSATIRFVMFEKARELGLGPSAARGRPSRDGRASPSKRAKKAAP